MSCACYEASVKSCSTEIKLKAGLAVNTSYYWIIENKFGKQYQRLVETDGEGILTIELDILPGGATNEFSGHYRLSLRTGANYLTTVNMTFGGKQYDCVSFNFVAMTTLDSDPENPYNVIQ